MISRSRARTHDAPGLASEARYATPLEAPHNAESLLTSKLAEALLLTCRAWPRGERLTLVPCPHVPSYFDRSHCAKCGHELGSVAA
ncbi:hypothetical protein ThrDRAFT_04515 [Frankia casuarinae]|jgi:hypothetical protein|uniref:hypothetical protein n=1 Tax=Frankia casuarinae (strain DSM 45818 / CECT 9043 / HFP020203 / CcI3) TaxID=106370 RepID=UPI0004519843|nr:hypothetical protein [Frankia casuarinae]EYT89874.1 hypothetical protein ThrDRAFT_04515 [Frankia casuarinae]